MWLATPTTLHTLEKIIWGSAYANAVGSASERARVADRTIRSLQALEERRGADYYGPEYKAARSNIRLELPEFKAWHRVQIPGSRGSSAFTPTKDQCGEAYERHLKGLGDFY